MHIGLKYQLITNNWYWYQPWTKNISRPLLHHRQPQHDAEISWMDTWFKTNSPAILVMLHVDLTQKQNKITCLLQQKHMYSMTLLLLRDTARQPGRKKYSSLPRVKKNALSEYWQYMMFICLLLSLLFWVLLSVLLSYLQIFPKGNQ